MANSTGPSKTASDATKTPRVHARTSRIWFSYLTIVAAMTVLSTGAGFFAGRLPGAFTKWVRIHPVSAAEAGQSALSELVSTPQPGAKNINAEEISHLAPQQQAEQLLELAIQQPDPSLSLIHRNLSSWRGHLEDSDRLFHLVMEALNSNDPRVRVAAVEIDLTANNLMKAPESVEKLKRQIQSGSDERYMALWRLGALGNRGVEPSEAFRTLKLYTQSRNQEVRFWAVEGLAMLGSRESVDALLEILGHDPAAQIRQHAANALSRSGLLTGEQRLTAVPDLLNLLDDDSLDAATQGLVSSTLQAITGASFGKNATAWRDWWAHHDSRETHPARPHSNLSVA
ncbi:MAG TPA: HEAT repeat domain-containing protein [Candidatus Acidoferrum sp.]|nr:HEAT repeat domain-containing protein [Candidatus Acidoferrum sp.]